MKVILLAAGFSSRMGELKQVMDLNGQPMLRQATQPFLTTGLELVVVVGHEHERVQAALHDVPCEVVRNAHPEAGMFSSVQCGCRAIAPGAACLLTTCDCPGIRPATIQRVQQTLVQHPANAVIPTYRGRRGHPAGLPAALVERIRTLPPDTPGVNSLWRRQPDLVWEIAVDDPAVLRDLDRPADVAALSDEMGERLHLLRYLP